jgi:hypothetical protein
VPKERELPSNMPSPQQRILSDVMNRIAPGGNLAAQQDQAMGEGVTAGLDKAREVTPEELAASKKIEENSIMERALAGTLPTDDAANSLAKIWAPDGVEDTTPNFNHRRHNIREQLNNMKKSLMSTPVTHIGEETPMEKKSRHFKETLTPGKDIYDVDLTPFERALEQVTGEATRSDVGMNISESIRIHSYVNNPPEGFDEGVPMPYNQLISPENDRGFMTPDDMKGYTLDQDPEDEFRYPITGKVSRWGPHSSVIGKERNKIAKELLKSDMTTEETMDAILATGDSIESVIHSIKSKMEMYDKTTEDETEEYLKKELIDHLAWSMASKKFSAWGTEVSYKGEGFLDREGYAPIPPVRHPKPKMSFVDAYGGDLRQISKALIEGILRPMESAGKQIAGDAPVDPDKITDAALASMGLGYGATSMFGGVPKGALGANVWPGKMTGKEADKMIASMKKTRTNKEVFARKISDDEKFASATLDQRIKSGELLITDKNRIVIRDVFGTVDTGAFKQAGITDEILKESMIKLVVPKSTKVTNFMGKTINVISTTNIKRMKPFKNKIIGTLFVNRDGIVQVKLLTKSQSLLSSLTGTQKKFVIKLQEPISVEEFSPDAIIQGIAMILSEAEKSTLK